MIDPTPYNRTEDLSEQVIFTTRGETLHLPGLPPMYDHELQPQEVRPPSFVSFRQLIVLQLLVKNVVGPFWIEGRK